MLAGAADSIRANAIRHNNFRSSLRVAVKQASAESTTSSQQHKRLPQPGPPRMFLDGYIGSWSPNGVFERAAALGAPSLHFIRAGAHYAQSERHLVDHLRTRILLKARSLLQRVKWRLYLIGKIGALFFPTCGYEFGA
jgi:hypothetical protein